MNSKKANDRVLDSSTSSNQAVLMEKTHKTKDTANSNLERAVAQRALFGSHHRRFGGRNTANHDARFHFEPLSTLLLYLGELYIDHCNRDPSISYHEKDQLWDFRLNFLLEHGLLLPNATENGMRT
ncbi:hypothetical protein L1049_016842 [Liquidambar formosana]|uniref:Uncharacterized protein n=1 Tax=Liquidambar formosana TaxID=63359 RepID=A0AAP0X3C6_LIQFO